MFALVLTPRSLLPSILVYLLPPIRINYVLFKMRIADTRGDLGDLIVSGRLQYGYVFVLDTDYGWRLYAAFDPE